MFTFVLSCYKNIFHYELVTGLILLTVTGTIDYRINAGTLFSHGEVLTEENERIPYKFELDSSLPGAIVFNVDELLWPFNVDKVMIPPLRAGRNKNQIRDRVGNIYELFNQTRTILDDLFIKWYKIGGFVISTDPEKIEKIMNLYDIEQYFKFYEIFPGTPGCKVKHMKRMSERLQVPLEEILYFDTDEEELDEVKTLNVNIVKVGRKQGITYKEIEKGFSLYSEAKNETKRHYSGLNVETITV